jgi:hypothetical protein
VGKQSPAQRLRRTRARHAAALLVALLLRCLSPPAAWAGLLDADTGFDITADSIAYEGDGQIYIAEGNVRVVQGDTSLAADWIAFSLASRRGAASGRVRIVDEEQVVEAGFMLFDVDTLQGVLYDGSIDSGDPGFLIRAKEMIKHGDKRYEVLEGQFSACRCPDEEDRLPWMIESRDTDVELGGYGKARNATVDILGVPLLWLPWLMYPVKSERASGLLFPEIGIGGGNGFQLGVPIFWAARHDVNVTITPSYLEKRGFKNDLDVEYLVGEHSGGRFAGSYVYDTTWTPGQQNYDQHRWAFLVEHDQSLPGGARARVDIKEISDNVYLNDFDYFGVYRRDIFLRSQVFAFDHFGKQGRHVVVGALAWADDILFPSAVDRDDTTLQRLPDLALHTLPGEVAWLGPLGVVGTAETRYTYFHAEQDPQEQFPGFSVGPSPLPAGELPLFLDTGVNVALTGDFGEGDGVFQEGELMLQHGHRFGFHPRIARPFQLGGIVDVYPEVGYAQTLYGASKSGFAERGVFTAQVDVRTRLRGEIQLPAAPSASHLFEPFVRWTWIEPRGQSGNPVYVPPSATPQRRLRHLAPVNRVLDPADRIARANVLNIGIQNRFRTRGPKGVLSGAVTELLVSYEHDFEQGGGGHLVASARSSFGNLVDTELMVAFDAERSGIDEGLAALKLKLPNWWFATHSRIGFRYRFLRDVPEPARQVLPRVNQFDTGFGFRLFERLQLNYFMVYALDDGGQDLSHRGSFVYASQCRCWSLGADIIAEQRPGNPNQDREIFFRLRYTIAGLGRDSDDPFARLSSLLDGFRP